MKREIILSTVPIFSEDSIQHLLDDFEAQSNIHVHVQTISWDLYRQEFVNTALHRLPCDVGITGMPATSDLIAMNALRPFSPSEIAGVGGAQAFLPARWRSGIRPNASEVWAIPLIADPRLLYYRQDLLQKAGIQDAAQAFATPQAMLESFTALQDAGIIPWLMLDNERHIALQFAISFIWAYGGDLFSEDGKRAIFHEPDALEGLRVFFQLAKMAPPDLVNKDMQSALLNGEVATAVMNAFGLYRDMPDEIGCLSMPGGSYVGGSDVLIWNHSRNEAAAVEFVRFLSQTDVKQSELGYLPVRVKELDRLADQPGKIAGSLVHAAKAGRSFPCVPMIGLTEDRLGMAIVSILHDLFTNPATDLETLLQQRIVGLGKRTNISLSSIL